MKKAILSVFIAIGVVIGFSPVVFGADQAVTTQKRENVYLNQKEIEQNKSVSGSVYCLANSDAKIKASIKGDVICATPATLDVSGSVDGDIRAAATKVVVSGEVSGDITVAANQVVIDKNAVIKGDVMIFTGSFQMNGKIDGNLFVSNSSSATINGSVGGDAKMNLGGSTLTIGDKAHFGKDFYYTASSEALNIKDKVAGKVHFEQHKENAVSVFASIVYWVGSFALIWFVMYLFMPRLFERARSISSKRVLDTYLYGVAVLFLPIIFGSILFAVPFGIMFGILLLLIWLIVMMVSGAFFAYIVGSFFFKSTNNIFIRGLAGTVVITASLFIPVVNVLMVVIGLVVGAGTFVITLANGYNGPGWSVQSRSNSDEKIDLPKAIKPKSKSDSDKKK